MNVYPSFVLNCRVVDLQGPCLSLCLVLRDLGYSYCYEENWVEGEKTCRTALTASQTVYGMEHKETAAGIWECWSSIDTVEFIVFVPVLELVGRCVNGQGRLLEAEEILRQSLNMAKKCHHEQEELDWRVRNGQWNTLVGLSSLCDFSDECGLSVFMCSIAWSIRLSEETREEHRCSRNCSSMCRFGKQDLPWWSPSQSEVLVSCFLFCAVVYLLAGVLCQHWFFLVAAVCQGGTCWELRKHFTCLLRWPQGYQNVMRNFFQLVRKCGFSAVC